MDLVGFLAVAVVIVVTPGPGMALVLRNTLSGGRIAGLATSVGTCSGLVVHAFAAALVFRPCSWRPPERSPW